MGQEGDFVYETVEQDASKHGYWQHPWLYHLTDMTEIHSAKLPNIIRTAIKKLKRAGVDMIATFHRDTCSVGRIFLHLLKPYLGINVLSLSDV